LQGLKRYLEPGISTAQLDQKAQGLLMELGAISAFKGYQGYPANICASVNEEVVHGIPGKRRLKEGDVISLDVGAKLNGYFGDVACTFAVGDVSRSTRQLLEVSRQALGLGLAQACEGNHLLDISSAIQSHVESCGFSVVRKFVGHGIGSKMHEEPEIPNFGQPGEGPILKPAMILAIEPMVNEGGYEVEILGDKWTARTKDGKLSAHFEHTVCITEGAPEILTAWE
jgi:methionyl aminopeptidase